MTPEEELKSVLKETGTTLTALREGYKTLEGQLAAQTGERKVAEEKMQKRLDELDEKRVKLEKDLTEERSKALHRGEERKDINGDRISDVEVYDDAKKQFENLVRTGYHDADITTGDSRRNESKATFQYRTKDGKKSASVIQDSQGGYTVMRDFSAQIMKKVFETSPILQEATVETIGTDRLEGIIDDNEASSGWVGEQESRTETNTPEIGEWSIPVREVYAMPKVTQKLLDDSSWNYEQFLIDKASEYISRRINEAGLFGDTNKRPKGIMTYAAGTTFRTQIEQVNLLDANVITAAGLIALQESLKDAYRAGAKFYFNRQTRRRIRVLTDSYGQFLLMPGLQRGAPNELLGEPMVIFQDMADVAANALPILYGNLKQGYKFVDRQGFRILRDPYTSKGYVLIYMTRRIGGDAWNREAVKIGKIAA